MFCDQCHWYTAGEKICPHCGAPQEPPEPEDAFGLKRPAPPKPEPEPAPVVIPAPPPVVRPVTVPPPAPYVRPKPAPTMSDSNKKGLKALAIVLAGVVVLVIVMLIAERASDDPYAFNEYENPYYEDYEYSTEPAPEVGDVLFFGNAQWRAADEDASGTALLLLREDEIYLTPGEVDEYPGESEYDYDVVYWGGTEFGMEEFGRVHSMFFLSPEEMERYGAETPAEIADDGLIAVRPAMWVSVE